MSMNKYTRDYQTTRIVPYRESPSIVVLYYTRLVIIIEELHCLFYPNGYNIML